MFFIKLELNGNRVLNWDSALGFAELFKHGAITKVDRNYYYDETVVVDSISVIL